jgi:bloom syndrome protein
MFPKRKIKEIIAFIKTRHLNDSGIVYCWKKDQCEKPAEEFSWNGLSAKYYHGDKFSEKQNILPQWRNGACCIVVATVIDQFQVL